MAVREIASGRGKRIEDVRGEMCESQIEGEKLRRLMKEAGLGKWELGKRAGVEEVRVSERGEL